MAPIHDTDLAAERWAKSEWERYELWEKLELRLRRRKWLWIAGTGAVFLGLLSIPIAMDRSPKWSAVRMARQLAQELSTLKKDAGITRQAHRIRFSDGANLSFVVERAPDCASPGVPVRKGVLGPESRAVDFAVIGADKGAELGVPGLIQSFCYDPLRGSELESARGGGKLSGFGILHSRDLAEGRVDRAAILLVQGPSAELSFE